MSDIAEGIGGAIEGALAGRAVEPARGKAEYDPSMTTSQEETCPNCGSIAPGSFCPECGQKTHIHRTLSAIAHDLVHGVLHLDGKLWKTLPLLTFKPGKLTRRYIEGERAQFVSPMSMFLFSVFSMFAIFQIIGISTPTTFDDQIGMEQVESSLNSAIDNNERTLREIEAELASDTLDEGDRANLEARRDAALEDLESLGQISELPFVDAEQPQIEVQPDGTRIIPIDSDGSARMSMGETGIDWLDEGLAKKWQENPGLMLYKLQANAYKFSWLLIPLSIPFVWLIFAWKRRFHAYDHAIFITYSLSFMSLMFIALSVLGAAGVPLPALFLAGMIIPPIHLYKHLRHTYEIGRFSSFWRLMVLSIFIWVVIGLFIQTLIMLGAF
ncbi:hypothetical protein NAP1_11353 [Erythrobacter sp. NAP1]|uniref:DUF3667 domain-containing protein n=1 Tax=Erythrobacter sp. NAP1 TaxID=237727 RepID=UPI0000687610|nr:DUF3667 domain-containing protein [Erythrobacter sp. NAP1]EAQ28188.1 hypothetical protein NAP1_11353 [Erythrobacter sp. NAP1]